jgi:hypothetical protein
MDSLIRHLESENAGAKQESAEVEEPEAVEAEAEEQEPVEEQQAEAEGEEEYDEDPLVPIRINGVEEQVPLSELMAGYSRNADYTRKTQAVAEERRQLESERSQLMLAQREAVERAAALADQLQSQIQANRPDPKELETLRMSDPAEYAARIADEQRRQALIQQAQQQISNYENQQTQMRVQNERQALMQKEPAFADDFDSTYTALGRWVTDPNGGGIPVEQWNREYDHNRILIAYRAWKADQQNAAATDRNSSVRAKVAKLPRIRSGARHEPGQTEQASYATALDKMSKTDSTRDIARALQARQSLKAARRDGDGYP